ncbi:MAG: oligosaccharide flippase family protein [Limisphaerales bacterium]
MSRLKKFTQSLLSGYVALGANIFYSLASVPLAFHYLGKLEFGLWALVTQIGVYLTLIDMGMGGAVSRTLIDHKDDRRNGDYGSVIKTGVLVGAVQGAIIILVGGILSVLAGSLLHVPVELRRDFVWLMVAQALLLGLSFAGRIFMQILLAHQQPSISNYSAAVLFFFNLAGMWAGLVAGWGVFSFLIGQAIMILGSIAVNAVGCMRLGLLPGSGEWGAANWERFKELFAFGNGVFLMILGSQLVSASQTILLTRLLGLETAAVWSVCTRTYTMLTLIVWRILDFSGPALSEMIVRKERGLLLRRLQDVSVITAGLGVVSGVLFAVSNDSFVRLWTAGKIHWPPVNDTLLALWFVLFTVSRTLTGFVSITKELHFLRFIFLVEGAVFIGLNLLAHRFESITLMLVFSVVCTSLFSLPYSLWRTRRYFDLGWRELAEWYHPTWQVVWRLVPVAVAVWWLAHGLPLRWRLPVDLALLGLWGGWLLLRHGLGKSLQSELLERVPAWVKRFAV